MKREIVQKVEEWAEERGIYRHSTSGRQLKKAMEEVGELAGNMADGAGMAYIADDIGDIQVCLINLCRICNLDFDGCLEIAYKEISKRTGKMVNGVFVKDGE